MFDFVLNVMGSNDTFKIQKKHIPVIFDTDMGNDIDDALALDMLYKYAYLKKIDIIGILSNNNDVNSVEYIDIMNNFYGFSNIPIGKISNGPKSTIRKKSYTKVVCENSKFPRSIKNYSSLPESVDLYRKLLSEQEDHSVLVISVGFLTNLSRLLESGPDKYSSLNGVELVSRKVRLLSLMGGDFSSEQTIEFNIKFDIASSIKVFSEWKSPIIVSPMELGKMIKFPGVVMQKRFKYTPNHPLVMGYESYAKMPYDRPTWDLTSVLSGVEYKKKYFSLSKNGIVSVDSIGVTSFQENKDGSHKILLANNRQSKIVLNKFVEIITRKPFCVK